MCCRDKNTACSPYVDIRGNPLFLRKGKPCTVGFCDGAVSAILCSQHTSRDFLLVYITAVVNYSNTYFHIQGKCMKQVQDVIERLWDFIDKLDINTFGELLMNAIISAQLKFSLRNKNCVFSGKFLADNIVGSVVVFSLLFWIPLSILVHCVVSHLQ